ncbi:MAG: helix-turn-helix transcriptional regulator [Treponemataceae bacterium]|nr:helix-turn-helix transcriptional regulator [Treponemataceae bacterium]
MENKLKELREKRGLSQAEVAQEIGISRQMYNKYERGDTEPSLSAIKALCTLYAVSYEELLDSGSALKTEPTYKISDPVDDWAVASPEIAYGSAKKASSSSLSAPSSLSPYGTKNYFAQIMSLLPKLLLSEKSRLLTAVAQSMTEEVEVQVRSRKSQPMKVNQDDVYFPTDEEYEKGMKELLEFTKSIGFSSKGVKWTREDMHER